MTRGVLLSHPTLNANVREATVALERAGLLAELHTTIDTTTAARITRGGLGRQLARRALPPPVHRLTRSHPMREVWRLVAREIPILRREEVYAPDAPAHALDRIVSRRLRPDRVAGVYCYEDAALHTLRRAAELGLPGVYELPAPYWRTSEAILEEEERRRPEWASTIIGSRLVDQDARRVRKDAELAYASSIVVASSFAAAALEKAGPTAPVHVVPYGAPPVTRGRREDRSGPLRVLYVGQLSQRKGLSYLFEAVAALGAHASLTVVGREVAENPAVARALAAPRVRWYPSLPHADVIALMRAHDVLVFPSLADGFGMAITEALSQGLPVIATDHTAAPDLLTPGEDGWIVPIRSAEAIQEALESVLGDTRLWTHMSHAARETAGRLGWDGYRERAVRVVRSSLAASPASGAERNGIDDAERITGRDE